MTFSLPCRLLGCSQPGADRFRQKWRIPPHWETESYLNDEQFQHLCRIETHLNVAVMTVYLTTLDIHTRSLTLIQMILSYHFQEYKCMFYIYCVLDIYM